MNFSTWKTEETCGENTTYLAQACPDLLTYKGRKFDMRTYIYVPSFSPFVALHHTGYLRVSTKNLTKDLSKTDEWVTNTHHQQPKLGFMYSNNSHDHIIDWEEAILDVTETPDERALLGSRIKELLRRTAGAVRNALVSPDLSPQVMARHWTLFGVDIIITKDLHPLVLEVNTNPALHGNAGGYVACNTHPWAHKFDQVLMQSMAIAAEVQLVQGNFYVEESDYERANVGVEGEGAALELMKRIRKYVEPPKDIMPRPLLWLTPDPPFETDRKG